MKLQSISNCPICNHPEYQKYLSCIDHTVSHQEFTIVSCQYCGFLFTNPRPEEAYLGTFYQSEEYVSHANKVTGIINFLYKIIRGFTLRNKINLINRLNSPNQNLLDYGCGTGHFLNSAQSKNWTVSGVEPDEHARSQAEKLLKKSVADTLENLDEQPFGIITLWHVMEHIPALNQTLVKLKDQLHDQGTLVVAVPNHQSWDAEYYKQYWAAYDVPRHLYHFDQESMKNLASSHQLKIVTVLPMKMDSYYVSLLSEKYKGSGISGYPKAFVNGLRSNINAKYHHQNYSSLIYILVKDLSG